MLSTRDPPQNKGHIQTESKGRENDVLCKWRPKESKNRSDKIDCNKDCERDKEDHYIMTKGSVQEKI